MKCLTGTPSRERRVVPSGSHVQWPAELLQNRRGDPHPRLLRGYLEHQVACLHVPGLAQQHARHGA
jgi:hypothetical protein